MPAYVGKILDGAKLSELPVVTQIKLRLAINVEIAGTLGVHAPATLFARTDEVIEQRWPIRK